MGRQLASLRVDEQAAKHRPSIGVNPMKTIVAPTLRNADRWTDDLLRGVV